MEENSEELRKLERRIQEVAHAFSLRDTSYKQEISRCCIQADALSKEVSHLLQILESEFPLVKEFIRIRKDLNAALTHVENELAPIVECLKRSR